MGVRNVGRATAREASVRVQVQDGDGGTVDVGGSSPRRIPPGGSERLTVDVRVPGSGEVRLMTQVGLGGVLHDEYVTRRVSLD